MNLNAHSSFLIFMRCTDMIPLDVYTFVESIWDLPLILLILSIRYD